MLKLYLGGHLDHSVRRIANLKQEMCSYHIPPLADLVHTFPDASIVKPCQ